MYLSLKEALKALRHHHISPSELTKACFDQVENFRALNAFITVTEEVASKQSKSADVIYEKSADFSAEHSLNGIPIAVKDNFCTENVRTTCASNMLKEFYPPYTSTVVRKLLGSGGILMGKTNMDEFGMGCGSVDSIFGPVRNPWCYEFDKGENVTDWYIAGGSSGGSAVAVATGMVYAALGSDTGGSVRNPASCTGVVGLKPTYGLASRHGLIPLVNSMDVPAIFTRTVDDAALVLNCIAGHDSLDSTTSATVYNKINLPEYEHCSVKDIQIGIPMEYFPPDLSADTLEAWNKTADLLENHGAKLKLVSLPHTQYSIVCYSILCACEVASNMARYDGIEFGHRATDERFTEALYATTRHEGFNEVVRGRILAGNYFLLNRNYERYFKQAQKVRRLILNDFNTVFQDGIDLLLTPTLLGDAPKHSIFSLADNRTRTQEHDIFTQPVNMAGIPAVNVPISLSKNGLPVGLQLIGQLFQEQKMLQVAKWIEKEVNFPHFSFINSG